jgi:Na+/phosphate symporter
VTRIIPGEEKYVDSTVKHLNLKLIKHSPSVALGQAKEEIVRIDKMEKEFRRTHIMCLNERSCTGDAGILFVDIISNLERIW